MGLEKVETQFGVFQNFDPIYPQSKSKEAASFSHENFSIAVISCVLELLELSG
jgi:hypothetical protein